MASADVRSGRPDLSSLDAAVGDTGPGGTIDDTAIGAPDVVSLPDSSSTDLGPFEWNPDDETLPIFEDGVVNTLEITMPDDQLQGLLDCWSDPPTEVITGKAKCWFTCTATLLGKTSGPGHCRPKGSPDKWYDQRKPQLIIRFDKDDKAGRFFGMRRLNLEVSSEGRAPVRDRLGMWFMREAGVPAPRVALASVTVNGKPYGPYQVIESIDKEFLDDHFANPEGDLYDDEGALETNETTSTVARYEELNDLIDTELASLDGDHTAMFAGLVGLADVDAFVRMIAAEKVIATTDNYSDGAGNTYIYDQHPGPGLLPLPWDLDEIFKLPYADAEEAVDQCVSSSDFASEPNPFCTLLWAHPPTRTYLVAEIRRLANEVLPRLPAQLTRYCAEARPLMLADPFQPSSIEELFDEDCAAIATFLETRAAFLANDEILSE